MLFFAGRHAPRRLAKGGAGVSVGRGCGCGKSRLSARVMSALGMKSAAAMHAGRDHTLTLAHIQEEEATLFPALRAVDPAGTKKDIERLMGDHDFYRPLLEKSLPVPEGDAPHSIDTHAALEDALIERYADALLELASHGGPSVSGRFDMSRRWESSRARAYAAIGSAVAAGAALARFV